MRISRNKKAPVLDPLHPLQSCVLEILAAHSGLEIAELHERIKREYDYAVSVQNLYKTVARLIEKQLLIRDGGLLFLNLVWVTQMSQYANLIKNTYLRASALDSDLPLKQGQERKFYANSLLGLDPIWSHVLMQLAGLVGDTIWYEYDSHPWHLLALDETEARLHESLVSQGITVRTILGHSSFLDHYGKQLAELRGYDVTISDQQPFLSGAQSLFVCGDYIVRCSLPLQIANHFEVFFENIRSLDNFDSKFFADVFTLRARCTLTVAKDRSEASKLRRQFTLNTEQVLA